MIIPCLKFSYYEGNVLRAVMFCDNCECEILPNETVYQSEQHEICEYCFLGMDKDDCELIFGEEKTDFDEMDGDELLQWFLKRYRRLDADTIFKIGMNGRLKLRKMGYNV